MDAKLGDKVRLKASSRQGERGVVEKVLTAHLIVRLDSSDEEVRVSRSDVTNYSLAARKAWEKMPQRQVGRPKGSRTADRVSVTLRIDRDIWERFRDAERSGTIEDRTSTINGLLAAKLTELERENRAPSAQKKDR